MSHLAALVVFVFFTAAEQVFAENKEQNYKRADVEAEHVAFEDNHEDYDNPHYVAACVFPFAEIEFWTASATVSESTEQISKHGEISF